ncbi:MAG: hypothetical protein CYPHOPRED_003204 [Cyphobasidiales sp. Tagirdzhanova-0007]|nr:MAG: hypothetical protein CYPHOPRED_003204 [Cyphobasidiales sp. Tagirdzhanova-0007]
MHSEFALTADRSAQWGGIHPLHAAARHQNNMAKAVRQCLDQAALDVSELDAVAYTRGPGMPSCLASCALAAKTLAAAYQKPLIGVHHMQAHALTVGLTEDDPPAYPYLSLLISGGHTLLLVVRATFDFQILATTADDSIGDAFDKVARLLDIPWGEASAAGQALEDFALDETVDLNMFSVPMRGQLKFSYSGLKSAVRRELEGTSSITLGKKRRIAAAFQASAILQLEEKIRLALQKLKAIGFSSLVVSGGVASNAFLRQRLRTCLDENGCSTMRLLFPPPTLCTDNAVMIAWAALEKFRRGMWDSFDTPIRPRWSIEECGDASASQNRPNTWTRD